MNSVIWKNRSSWNSSESSMGSNRAVMLINSPVTKPTKIDMPNVTAMASSWASAWSVVVRPRPGSRPGNRIERAKNSVLLASAGTRAGKVE